MLRRLVLVLALGAALAPGRGAQAANGNKPRVAVVWSAADCATIVDQSTAPVVHFDYTIASEEDPADRTADEVDDSRTHQFFAFAKQDFAGDPPRWIAHADIIRASMVDPEVVEAEIDPEEILEDTTRFGAADWVRITPDDARVPISFAQAAMGVDWDTTSVAPGTYEIWGYTWEPVLNLWNRRGGFVKVIASAAAADGAGPSIALLADEAQITAGAPYTPPGCADVGPDATVTLQWGESVGTVEPSWQTAIEDEAIDSGALGLAFVPPDEAGGKSIRLRAIVTDGDGRTYTAYAPGVLVVAPNPDPGGDDGGGGCVVGDRVALPPWMTLLLLLPRSRRRRDTAARCVTELP